MAAMTVASTMTETGAMPATIGIIANPMGSHIGYRELRIAVKMRSGDFRSHTAVIASLANIIMVPSKILRRSEHG